MVVFQFMADEGRWVYINPPLTQRTLNPSIFKSQKLHEKSEYKIYSLQGVGPKYPKSSAKKGEDLKVFNGVQKNYGGRCTEVPDFLRLPKWRGTKEILARTEMLTTASQAEEREAYLLKNLKFVDDWL